VHDSAPDWRRGRSPRGSQCRRFCVSDSRDFAIEPQLHHSFPPIVASAVHNFSPVLASTTWRYQRCVVIGTATPVPVAVCPATDDDNVEMTTHSVLLAEHQKQIRLPFVRDDLPAVPISYLVGYHCLTGIFASAFHWAFGGTREWPHGALSPLSGQAPRGSKWFPGPKPKASDDTLGTFNVGTNPLSVAFDGANIWVANAVVNGTVSKM
jgi:hypothetical protein